MNLSSQTDIWKAASMRSPFMPSPLSMMKGLTNAFKNGKGQQTASGVTAAGKAKPMSMDDIKAQKEQEAQQADLKKQQGGLEQQQAQHAEAQKKIEEERARLQHEKDMWEHEKLQRDFLSKVELANAPKPEPITLPQPPVAPIWNSMSKAYAGRLKDLQRILTR